MTTPAELATSWRALAELSLDARIAEMQKRQLELLGHPEAQIAGEMQNLVEAEVASDDATMAELTRSRLQSWLVMDKGDVVRLSTAVEAARETMAGPQAMRSTMAVQAAIRTLEKEDVVRLIELGPLLRKSVSAEMLDMFEALDARGGEAVESAVTANGTRKPWWKFW